MNFYILKFIKNKAFKPYGAYKKLCVPYSLKTKKKRKEGKKLC